MEVAVAHQLDQHIGVFAGLGHGDVEMLNARGDVGHDFRELRLAVGAVAVGEHPHRPVVFADAVDAAGEMIFGAERGLQKAFDDLAVGEDLLLGALALRDGGNFRRMPLHGTRVSPSAIAPRAAASVQQMQESAGRAHSNDAAAIGACAQGLIARSRALRARVPPVAT